MSQRNHLFALVYSGAQVPTPGRRCQAPAL
ncbi:hypothetical protein CMEL01_01330 [Colletotrichum melonis]|uniref:Uncharacterized protein n=1 Tax=Colletotrichum melonis TaxID=1209925 RepID=A0AAI9V8C9_9PEZI|nr:hypothetical protein CMEL01_01330 [Colletotrichum melonis]